VGSAAEVKDEQQSGGGGGLSGLIGLSRLLKGPIGDIRKIAEGMQYLPELARTLADIRVAVKSMDDEVRRMRRGVDSMGADVERLAPQLSELQDSIPLRRLRRKGNDDSANS
jgi:hypothetical protein